MTEASHQLRQRARSVLDAMALRADRSYSRLAKTFELPDGNRRVYCHHVRKTAGTSLYLSFMALGGEDPMDVWRRIAASRFHRTISGNYSFVAHDRDLLAQGDYFYGRSHRPAVDQPLPPKTFTVTVLRDPIQRVRSYFDYLVAGDDPAMPGQVGKRERRQAMDGFDAFLDRVPDDDLLNQLAMFSTGFNVSEAVDRIGACSAVFFTEDFAHGLSDLAGRLELPLAVTRSRVAGTKSTLSEAQTERLRSRLEPEYELLAQLDAAGIASATPR